jgi:hypothetical protein
MRFLLPTFPALIAAGVWALAEMTRNAPRAARVAVPLTLLGVQMLWGVPQAVEQTQRLRGANGGLAVVSHALDETAGRDDVIVAGPQILQNLDFVRHWKLADASLARGGMVGPPMGGGGGAPRMMNGPGRGFTRDADPDAPSPMQQQKREHQAALYPGSPEDREEKFAADVRRWAGAGHAIYLVGAESEVRRMLGDAARSKDIAIVKRVALPTLPSQPDDGPGGPGGPGGNPRQLRGRGFAPAGRGMGGPGGGGRPPMGTGLGDAPEIVIARWTPVGDGGGE